MAFLFNNGALILNGSYWTSTTHKIIAVSDTYAPNRDDVFVSTVSTSELSGSGYTRGFGSPGRRTLSSKTAYVDTATNTVKFGCANSSFLTISAGTCGGIVIIEEKTTDADSLLIAYIESATAQLTNGSSMPVNFENGIALDRTT